MPLRVLLLAPPYDTVQPSEMGNYAQMLIAHGERAYVEHIAALLLDRLHWLQHRNEVEAILED